MLALLFLTGAALLGVCVTRRVLRGTLDAAELVCWGMVVGWMFATVFVYALARWQGRLTHALVAWATAFIWLAAALLLAPVLLRLRREGVSVWPRRHARDLFRRENLELFRRKHLGLASVLILFAPIYWHLFSTHTFAQGEGGVYSGGSAWYDLSFHAALASSFLYGENFPPVYTPMPPEALLYPFMPDFHAAVLVAAGLSLRAALLATALPLALLTTGLFYSLAMRIARGALAAALATLLFLLNGGLGFTNLYGDWRQSGHSFPQFWSTLGVNYANDWSRGIHWTNLITDTFLPQRASLYGLPAALMIFTLFASVWRRRDDLKASKVEAEARPGGRASQPPPGGVSEVTRPPSRSGFRPAHPAEVEDESNDGRREPGDVTLLLAAGVLAGLLPLFHTHTYIAVGLVSIFLFVMRPRRAWLAFWTPAVLLAAPYLLDLARHAAATGGILRLQPGWMGDDAPSFTLYLLRNFGLPLLLAVPAWLDAPRVWKSFYIAFVLLLVFSLVVVVSPNVFDNGKLTYYWHALNSVLIARWLVHLARARRLRLLTAPLALLLVLCSVATGLAALQAESRASSRLFTDADFDAAQFARAYTPPRALFLTAPVINQPVLCLAGRPVVRGATAWLWGHGYEFREREADVRRIYAGAPNALELLQYYGVDYVYLGEAERRELKADTSFFESNFTAVYRGAGITIYDARARTNAAPAPRELARPAPHELTTPAPRELASRIGQDPYALLAEFPRTSFFVYRLFKASYGRMPRRAEFMDALSFIGRGLFIGARGWEQRLEANRRALVEELMAGEEFERAYGVRTNAEFVAALSSNAGLDAKDGDAIVKRLDAGTESRASILLHVADDERFYAREYDTAYVLVHFFGYLGRNPEDPPDRDLGGLDFWRDVLARTGDYRSISRAFLESEEYKSRPLEP
ncbi:MAG: hypothetical protein QOC99_1289 [Acidobacteriota bacterium]|nr:hypothetical protein [Acidobacteriota bacterium]